MDISFKTGFYEQWGLQLISYESWYIISFQQIILINYYLCRPIRWALISQGPNLEDNPDTDLFGRTAFSPDQALILKRILLIHDN